MATYDPTTALNNLLTRKQTIAAEIAAWAAGTVPMLPNAEGAGSQDFEKYIQGRYDELERIDKAIAILQGPFEILQQGMT